MGLMRRQSGNVNTSSGYDDSQGNTGSNSGATGGDSYRPSGNTATGYGSSGNAQQGYGGSDNTNQSYGGDLTGQPASATGETGSYSVCNSLPIMLLELRF
jgi:hypothetical protein